MQQGPPPSYQQTYGDQRGAYTVQKNRDSVTGGSPSDELRASHGWRDLGWAIAFWLQALVLLITGFICYRKYRSEFAPNTSTDNKHRNDIGPLQYAMPLIGACLGFGSLVAILALYMMKNHGVVLIWCSLIFTLIMSGLVVILAAAAGNLIGVIICGLIFALTCWYIYSVRHKIPFAAAMLDVSLRSMSEFPATWLLPVYGIIMMALVSYLWSIASFSIVYAVDNGGNDSARSVRGLIFFLLVLSTFWTFLVVRGWVHTCVAGVTATWFFLHPQNTPKHPVWGAIKRASTTSFGSICFGSFIVAFIRTLRFFVRMAYQNARESNNQFAACALCILECLIGCLESIVNYINQYAFAIVAIYGSPFLDSASKAWSLMKSRGYDAVVNDSLVGGVLSLCILIGGLSTGIVGGLLAYYAFDTDWRPWAGIGFLIGAVLLMVISEVVESAIIALFICLADDPVSLQRSKPDEYRRLTDPLNVYYPNRNQQQNNMV